MSAQISHDGFARTALYRKREYDLPTSRGCTWCGQEHRTPKGRPYLYRYQTESDGGRAFGWGNPFCSIDCMRTYNN